MSTAILLVLIGMKMWIDINSPCVIVGTYDDVVMGLLEPINLQFNRQNETCHLSIIVTIIMHQVEDTMG